MQGATQDLLSAIWATEDKPAGQRSAGDAAAASLDRCLFLHPAAWALVRQGVLAMADGCEHGIDCSVWPGLISRCWTGSWCMHSNHCP